ncbi:hypothetical protein [Micromonospora radicis]|uniref:Uncharacterized protein n=1 Tax=Micromonospora radicis TaxID=1894971 RepID=A0A418MY39_9ACTN|nr:hypothetical protein [Micromonospora radicis]RIV40019.1 hypothetical protein D2L64_06770 [Micromonospora radicis]
MSTGREPARDRAAMVGRLLEVAVYHRQHERYYAQRDLLDAVRLKQWASTLRSAAEAWRTEEHRRADPADVGVPPLFGPLTSATGPAARVDPAQARDIDELAVATLVRDLTGMAERYRHAGQWLDAKMAASWPREEYLLQPGLSRVAPARFRALTSTTLNALRMRITATLTGAAVRQLRDLAAADASERAVRAIVAAGLVDEAGAALTRKAAQLGGVDEAWQQVIGELAAVVPDAA